MARSSAPILATVGLALAASTSPLVAQKAEQRAETMARGTRAANDSLAARMRRLEQSVDSLVRSFEAGDLTPEQRIRTSRQIDQTVFELARLRAAVPGARFKEGNVFIRRPEPVLAESFGPGAPPRFPQTPIASGWIGLVVSGAPVEVRIENSEMFMRYLAYPEIASVDPSSPAQQAGIVPGDTLMAYNGRDVKREEISMTKLLKPKSTVNVRIRRDGSVKDLPVVVVEAPARIKLRRDAEMRDASAPWVVVPREPMLARTPFSAPVPRTPAPPARAGGPMVASTPRVPMAPVFDLAPSGIAGAQMTTITESMKRSWALPAGVLVTTVPVGSPAAESGLEDGDVILRANRQTVVRVNDLRAEVARALEEGERSVTLEIRRGKQRRTITLRWDRN